jgi:hypothetical protein
MGRTKATHEAAKLAQALGAVKTDIRVVGRERSVADPDQWPTGGGLGGIEYSP